MSGDQIQANYQGRINRVFHYIVDNLDSDLSLDIVSKTAYFSPYHFHRIFKISTGETLNAYVTRLRIEKVATGLIHKRNHSITELSLQYGFKDNSSLTRAFKKFYGVSPTEFRKQNPNKFSKISQLKSKNGQEYPNYDKYICNITNLKKWIDMNAKIEIKVLSKKEVAYITCIGSQNLGSAFDKLMKWAIPKGLFEDKETKMATIYHDSFKITEPHKVRMSACVLLPESIVIDGEIGASNIEEGKFIVGSFQIGVTEFEKSWTGLFLWMNEKGYKKAGREPFEIYHNDFNEHPEKICFVDFYIPIQ